jgi:type IV secretion system protein TrbI
MGEAQDPTPVVQKKALIPPGVLPRNAQAWFIAGISVLMILVIAFSGSKQPKEKLPAKTPTSQGVDPNEQRIQEYRARIDAQAQKLLAEQADLARAKQAFGIPTNAPVTSQPPTHAGPAGQAPLPYERAPVSEKSWIETDKEKREYQSLYASNVALSYREDTKTEKGTNVSNESPQKGNDHAQASVHEEAAKSAKVDPQLQRSDGPKYHLFEGTVIETVLTNRLDGSFSGPVNCMVTTNVYSHDRQHLLVPQGARVLGEVKRAETFGQERLAVAFHRFIMPDGYSVSLDQFQGLNQIGETGLRDQVNHHYLQVFGVSLAIGAIAGFSQINTRSGIDTSAEDAYRQGVASSLSQSSLRILDRYLNVLPTYTIREGHRVKVYLAGDLLLPAYDKHQMPSDL